MVLGKPAAAPGPRERQCQVGPREGPGGPEGPSEEWQRPRAWASAPRKPLSSPLLWAGPGPHTAPPRSLSSLGSGEGGAGSTPGGVGLEGPRWTGRVRSGAWADLEEGEPFWTLCSATDSPGGAAASRVLEPGPQQPWGQRDVHTLLAPPTHAHTPTLRPSVETRAA